MVEKVNRAIACLRADGKRVTQIAISGMVGMHTKGLFRYPKTKAILLEVADNNKQKVAPANRANLICQDPRFDPCVEGIGAACYQKNGSQIDWGFAWAHKLLPRNQDAFRQRSGLDRLATEKTQKESFFLMIIGGGQVDSLSLPSAAQFHPYFSTVTLEYFHPHLLLFLQLCWNFLFFYSYAGKHTSPRSRPRRSL